MIYYYCKGGGEKDKREKENPPKAGEVRDNQVDTRVHDCRLGSNNNYPRFPEGLSPSGVSPLTSLYP